MGSVRCTSVQTTNGSTAGRHRTMSILRETSGSASMTASSKLGSKDALKSLQEEFKKRKEEKKSALDMDVGELFKQEPSWRGQRRKKLLASRFEEADAETAIRVGKGKQELWEASRVGNFERVMELLFSSKDYVPSHKELGMSIHNAAKMGREDTIDLLIRHGADPSDSDMPMEFTPIMVAASKGHVHAMLLLIDRGGRINDINELGQTALHIGCLRGHAHIVKALVAEGAEAWHKDKYGRTAYDCAQMDTEEHGLCREIIIQGVPRPKEARIIPPEEDVDGKTPVHHWLVSSVHGEPRVCAYNGLERPTNQA